MTVVLFPSDFFNEKKVDEDLKEEYEAAKKIDSFVTVLFGYDKWFSKSILKLNKSFDVKVMGIYRGWMMSPEKYRRFYELLEKENIQLITSPEQYERMHMFPNVYSLFEKNGDTPKMEIYPLHEEIDIEIIKKKFKRFMVKDFVKSVKGTDFPAYFDQTVTQEEFNHWMDKFYMYRGELLTGGICIKEFVELKKYGNKTNEYRVFYLNNHIATISRNSGQKDSTPLPPTNLIERYKYIDSPFYTIDFAELEDGIWMIIEAGDGSVSGLSMGQDYEEFYRELEKRINHKE